MINSVDIEGLKVINGCRRFLHRTSLKPDTEGLCILCIVFGEILFKWIKGGLLYE